VTLRRGAKRMRVRLESVPADEAPLILQAYLRAYRSQVQQFFSIAADAGIEEFAGVAPQHPVFRVVEIAS
jgi:hypothetical protein